MKVKELIQILAELDPEAIVVVSGYEGGVNDVDYVVEHKVALNVNQQSYLGKHEIDWYPDCFEHDYPESKYEIVKGVYIS